MKLSRLLLWISVTINILCVVLLYIMSNLNWVSVLSYLVAGSMAFVGVLIFILAVINKTLTTAKIISVLSIIAVAVYSYLKIADKALEKADKIINTTTNVCLVMILVSTAVFIYCGYQKKK
ncbi:MAG: hypothetical protein FD123_784 [Bacteroidetes bacterium]|nr:MAG: hypothetical protein FD123_784 [Bacteroidota bacterium]